MMKTQSIDVGRVPRPAPGAHARLSERCVSHLTRESVFSEQPRASASGFSRSWINRNGAARSATLMTVVKLHYRAARVSKRILPEPDQLEWRCPVRHAHDRRNTSTTEQPRASASGFFRSWINRNVAARSATLTTVVTLPPQNRARQQADSFGAGSIGMSLPGPPRSRPSSHFHHRTARVSKRILSELDLVPIYQLCRRTKPARPRPVVEDEAVVGNAVKHLPPRDCTGPIASVG